MKKIGLKFISIGAFAFMLFAFLAPQRAEAWEWSFIRGQDWDEIMRNTKFDKDSGIKKGDFYQCDNILFIWALSAGNPAEFGCLQFKAKDGKITRRDLKGGAPEGFMLYKGGEVSPGDRLGKLVAASPRSAPLRFVVWRDIEWYKMDAKTRFFSLEADGKIEFDQDKPGFKLVSGTIKENTNFKTIAHADQVMDLYTGVPTSVIKNAIDLRRKTGNFGNNNEALAMAVYLDWTTFAGLLGAASGLAPTWALPLEFAGNFQDNMQKAYMSYAIAYALNKEPSVVDDDFKNDLFILFDENNLEDTIGSLAKATGWTGNAADLIKAGKIVEKIGKSKIARGLADSKVTARVVGKFTVKGASKVTAAITKAAPWVGGVMGAAQAAIFGKKALDYYKAK